MDNQQPPPPLSPPNQPQSFSNIINSINTAIDNTNAEIEANNLQFQSTFSLINSTNRQTANTLFTNIFNEIMGEIGLPGNSINDSFENDQSKFKYVITEEGKNLLTKKKYIKEECQNTSCPISLIEFSEESDIILLPCKHAFEEEPIMKWLTTINSVCPICRYELPSHEVRKAPEPMPQSAPQSAPNLTSYINDYMRERIAQSEENDMQTAILASLGVYNEE